MPAILKLFIDSEWSDTKSGWKRKAVQEARTNETALRPGSLTAQAPTTDPQRTHPWGYGRMALLLVAVSALLGGCGSDSTTPIVAVTAVSVNATSVKGGTSATGTVTLSAAAPANGAVVTLASSPPTVGTVPASVTVAAGATTATFTVATTAVTANTPVTIFAADGGFSSFTTLTVTP